MGDDKKYRSKPGVKKRIHKQLNEKYHNDPIFRKEVEKKFEKMFNG